MNNDHEGRKALEELIFDTDLEQLEALIAEFNIFEAIGVYRQELRHSDFLSFLLDPNQNHGLRDAFLKRFLMRLLMDSPAPPLSAVDIDLMDMDQVDVRREWQAIDILIHDSANQLVVLIENKVDSKEHSSQLQRYLEICEHYFPEARCIIPIFLTPAGTEPSDDRYLTITYETVAEVLDHLLKMQSSTMGPDVRTLVNHYVTMLRRHIVSDSQIAELARQIYRRHQRALDLILEHRPDLQTDIFDYLVNLIHETPDITEDYSSKSYIRFTPNQWDQIPDLHTSRGWTNTGRILLFEFRNSPNRLSIAIIIGPGDPAVRERLFGLAESNPNVFRNRTSRLYDKYTMLFSLPILSARDYVDANLETLSPKINRAWERFLEEDLNPLVEMVNNEFARESTA